MVAFGAAAAVLGVFLAWERRQAAPDAEPGVLPNRRFSAASGAVTLTFFALFGTLFLVSQYLQSVLGYTALQSGIRYLPLAATLLVVVPVVGEVGRSGSVRRSSSPPGSALVAARSRC